MAHWAMVIDLRKCIGCKSCILICNQVNNVSPGSEWRRVVGHTFENENTLNRFFLTMSCMHCQDPPCLKVCPTKATYQTNEGVVGINQDLCIGCSACILACPYKTRSINRCTTMGCYEKFDCSTDKMWDKEQIGVCSKCDFCLPVIENGLKNGLRPGDDTEATPMCVRYCLGKAISFGDLDDPDSQVSQILIHSKATQLLEELGTNPSVYYILTAEEI